MQRGNCSGSREANKWLSFPFTTMRATIEKSQKTRECQRAGASHTELCFFRTKWKAVGKEEAILSDKLFSVDSSSQSPPPLFSLLCIVIQFPHVTPACISPSLLSLSSHPPRTHSVCPIKFVFTMLTHTWPDTDRAQFALSISLVPKCRTTAPRSWEGPIEQHFAFSKQQKSRDFLDTVRLDWQVNNYNCKHFLVKWLFFSQCRN